MTNHPEATLLARMASSTSYAEQVALATELATLRAQRQAALAEAREVELGEQAVSDHLTSAGTWMAHTAATDWLLETATDPGEDVTRKAALARATTFMAGLHPAVRANPTELAEQAMGLARFQAGAYGWQAPTYEQTFLAHVGTLRQAADDDPETVFCPHCGAEGTPGKTCESCGQDLRHEAKVEPWDALFGPHDPEHPMSDVDSGGDLPPGPMGGMAADMTWLQGMDQAPHPASPPIPSPHQILPGGSWPYRYHGATEASDVTRPDPNADVDPEYGSSLPIEPTPPELAPFDDGGRVDPLNADVGPEDTASTRNLEPDGDKHASVTAATIDEYRKIVSERQHGKVAGQPVDLTTAHAIVSVHDALSSDEHKAKLLAMHPTQAATVAYKLLNRHGVVALKMRHDFDSESDWQTYLDEHPEHPAHEAARGGDPWVEQHKRHLRGPDNDLDASDLGPPPEQPLPVPARNRPEANEESPDPMKGPEDFASGLEWSLYQQQQRRRSFLTRLRRNA